MATDPTLAGMRDTVDHQNSFANVMSRISLLPADERVDALLEFFGEVLNVMDLDRVRQLRDRIMERFATCGCSFETSLLMIEFINAQLALREQGSRRSMARNR